MKTEQRQEMGDPQTHRGGQEAADPGRHRQNHEDQEGVETPTAHDRGPQSVGSSVQTENPRDQEVYRHLDREGILGASRRPEGHLQLLSINTTRPVHKMIITIINRTLRELLLPITRTATRHYCTS